MKKRFLLPLLILTSCSTVEPGVSSSTDNTPSESSDVIDSSSVDTSSTTSSSSTESSSTDATSSSSSSSSESSSSTSSESSSSSSSSSSVSSSSSSSSSSSAPTIIEVEDIILAHTVVMLKPGDTYQISATLVPSNATNRKLTYASSDTNVATVSVAGKITAKGSGEAVISVTSSNNITKEIKVTVELPELPDLPGLPAKSFTKTTAPYYGNEYFYPAQWNPQTINIAEGVVYTKYYYAPAYNASARNVFTVTIDPKLAAIEAGTASSSYFPTVKALLKNQATAYESASGRKVLATVNGDYFGFMGGGIANGLLVKDGVVVNSKSVSYENLQNGMNVLAVSYNDVATIETSMPNANTNYRIDNYIELYDSKSAVIGSYAIDAINNSILMDPYQGNNRPRNYELITTGSQTVSNKNVIYLEKIDSYDNNTGNIKIPFDAKITSIASNYSGTVTVGNNQAALLVSSECANKASKDMRVRVGVTKSDNPRLSGVKTVIGGRHLLIKDYQIPSNLSKESTNDANSARARTAVGVLGDGKVVIFVCEDYTKGLSLPRVADFMRYIGCKEAVNLDGGGSTGLYIRENNSLTFKAGPNTGDNSRAVANTLLITEK